MAKVRFPEPSNGGIKRPDDQHLTERHDLKKSIRLQFNDPALSDVCFKVDGKSFSAHRFILAIGSPVFKSMFFGQLREQKEIEINDLTAVGFENVLRFLYGFTMTIEPSTIYETFRAADKYLVNGFTEAFFQYIEHNVDVENILTFFEELRKIENLEQIKPALIWIIAEIKEKIAILIETENFMEISQETLQKLLSLDELDITEYDLFNAVASWVDREVQRRNLPLNEENRRLVFEPIKGYILFDCLTGDQIANNPMVVQLLSAQEMGAALLSHFNEKFPRVFELKTNRRLGSPAVEAITSSEDEMEV